MDDRVDRDTGDHCVQDQVDSDEDYGDPDCLLEAFQEDGPQPRQKEKGDEHLTVEPRWGVRIMNKVRSGVRGR